MVFPVVMYGCESWTIKKAEQDWCFWTVVLEKTLESPLDCKEIQPVHPKGDQSWVFIERTDVEAETPILWPPDVKSWLTGKDPDAGKDWGQMRRGRQRMRWLDGITDSMDMGLGGLRELVMEGRPGVLWFIGLQRVRHDWATELNWTECRIAARGAICYHFLHLNQRQMWVYDSGSTSQHVTNEKVSRSLKKYY